MSDSANNAPAPRAGAEGDAKPQARCSECRTPLNEGEAKCFTVCDACWDRHYAALRAAAPARARAEGGGEREAGEERALLQYLADAVNHDGLAPQMYDTARRLVARAGGAS